MSGGLHNVWAQKGWRKLKGEHSGVEIATDAPWDEPHEKLLERVRLRFVGRCGHLTIVNIIARQRAPEELRRGIRGSCG